MPRLAPLWFTLAAAAWLLAGPAAVRAPAQEPADIAASPAASRPVHLLEVEDIIGPISSSYIADAIRAAEEDGAAALVLELDTPGGLMTSMRAIIKAILASEVPVCVYVAPEGAQAASAGAFVTIAAHVAAMAPGTNIGAASPVNMGGGMDSTMASKAFNDAEAYIRSLARLRGRNEEWAASAVVEAKSVQAEEAVEENVVDFIAASRSELLRKMDGMVVPVTGDTARVLRTAGSEILVQDLSLRYRILSLLNDPTIAYLLLMLGFYGLFFELSNPGAIFPGVVGGICIILGLLGLQTLTLNYAGLLLIVVALVLFFLETQVASHGLLTVGGAVSLVAGSLMLFESPLPFLRVSLKVVLPTAALMIAFFVFAVSMALRAQKRRVVSGREGLLGMTGEVRRTLDPRGTVFVAGEHWTAESERGETIPVGARVAVTAVENLLIRVRSVGPSRGTDAGDLSK